MTNRKIYRIALEIEAFPGMPTTAAKLLPLLENSDSTAAEIESILKYDPGLTANILKLTNSVYFGIPSRISSVRQAIVLLGWKRLLQVVMTICMSPLMNKTIPGYDLPRGALWQHSVAVSAAAEILVKALKIPDADEVFTAALLHDVGKLILGGFVKEDLQQIEDMVTKGITFDVAESMVLGTNHAEIGGQILDKWSFPAELVSAVQWHHDPESCEESCNLSDIVHVANTMGIMTGYGKIDQDLALEHFGPVADRLGLAPENLEEMARQTAARVKKLMVSWT
ncbi:MAG: HDOD domain-containing protein [Deltaproteobacteria bacterium]|nr:HDOD domain-containing protein [Deltaproteobacteria bacterium]